MPKNATPEERQEIIKELEKIKKSGELDKYGLTGVHGFVGAGIHLSANYSSGDDTVFVRDEEEWDMWERINTKDAKDRNIITCYYCDKPAVSLDHSWPYLQEHTTCAEHWEEWKKGE
jgi:hypothetical protein